CYATPNTISAFPFVAASTPGVRLAVTTSILGCVIHERAGRARDRDRANIKGHHQPTRQPASARYERQAALGGGVGAARRGCIYHALLWLSTQCRKLFDPHCPVGVAQCLSVDPLSGAP